jgi:hypothetical protein
MLIKYNNREVECELTYANDPCDSYIESAHYVDTGEELDDDALNLLTNDYAAEIAERHFEHMVGRAEAHYERDR